jgi:hypothetical protein
MMLSVSSGQILSRMGKGEDSSQVRMKGTCDFLLAIMELQPGLSARLAEALNSDVERMRERLLAVGNTKEPAPEPMKASAAISQETADKLNRSPSSVSATYSSAVSAAHEEATAQKLKSFTLGDLIYQLLQVDGDARTALAGLTSPETVDQAAEKVRGLKGAVRKL